MTFTVDDMVLYFLIYQTSDGEYYVPDQIACQVHPSDQAECVISPNQHFASHTEGFLMLSFILEFVSLF